MNSWTRVIVEWANCLGIVESTIESIDDLRDGVFYESLVSQLCCGSEENFIAAATNCRNERERVSKFIQAEYPAFGSVERTSDVTEELYIASLLLVQCSQQPIFHRPMCSALNHEAQIRIKRFLEAVLPRGKNLTRENMKAAITELGESVTSVERTPSTPKYRPLREFLNSPAIKSARTQRFMNERNRELMRLRAQLETEQFEKADLIEDLKIQSEKMCNLQKKLDEKTRELREIRNDRLRPPTPQSCRKIKRPSENEELYKRQIVDLEAYNSELVGEIAKLRDERRDLAERLTTSERFSIDIGEKYEQSEKSVESLTSQLEMRNSQLADLRANVEELREHVREMKRSSASDERSFDAESACEVALSSTIVDVQLQEARRESSELKNELYELRIEHEAALRDCENLGKLEITIREKQSELDSLGTLLRESEDKLSSRDARATSLELEISGLSEKLAKLKILLRKKDELLNETENRTNRLEYERENACSRARDLEILLNNANSRIIELTSRIELAEIEAKELRVVLSSREEKLSKVTDERDKMKLGLDEKIVELRDSLISLENEKSSVDRLETIVSRCNEESRDLRKILTSREEEILLVDEAKKLAEMKLGTIARKLETTEICLNEERDRAKDLRSRLVEANDCCENLRNLLAANDKLLADERTRIVELESTMLRRESENDDLQRILDESKIALRNEREGTDELREIVSRSKKTLLDLESLLQLKEQLLEEAAKRESALSDELKVCNLRIDDLTNSLRDETSRSNELEKQIFLAKENCRELEAELGSKEDLLRETEINRKNVETELNVANVRIMEIQSSMEILRTKLSSVEEEYERSILANVKLEEYARDADEKIVNFEIRISEYERRINDLDESSTAKTRELMILREKLNEKNIELDSLSSRLGETETRVASTNECLRESEKKIAELNELDEEMKCQMARELEKSTILRNENESLEEKLARYVRSTNDFEQKIVEIANELEETREILHKEYSMSEELQKKLEDSRRKNSELEEKLTKEKNDSTAFRTERDGLKEKLASYINETSVMRQRIENMEREVEKYQENLQKESSMSEELRKKLEDSCTNNNELEEKLTKEKNDLTTVLTERDGLKEQLASYINETSIMRQRIENMEREVEKYQENLQKESSMSEELRKKLEDSCTNNNELEEKLTKEKNDLTTVLTERDGLKEQLASYINETSIMRQRIENMEREIEKYQENLQKESSMSEELRKKLEDSCTNNNELEEKLKKEKNDLTTVLTERDGLKEQLASYINETSIMRQRIENMEREVEKYQENLQKESSMSEELRKTLEDSCTNNNELEEKLKKEKNELRTILTERDGLKEQLASYINETSIMRQRIENMEREIEKYQENLQKESSMSEELRKKLEDSCTNNNELEEKLTKEKNDLTTVLTERDGLKEQLASYINETSIMRQRIENMEREVEKYQENLQKESSMSEELRKKLEDSCTNNNELEEKLTKEKNELRTILTERDDLKEQLTSYISDTSIMRQRIDDMEREVEKYQENLQKESSMSEELRKKLEDSCTNNNELEEKLTKEKNELRTILTERDGLKEQLASYISDTSIMRQRIDDMEKELEQFASNLQKQIDANTALDKTQREFNEQMEKLHVQLSQERETVKNLENVKIHLDNELSSLTRAKADMIDQIEVLEKSLQVSRDNQQKLQETSDDQCKKLNQRIAQLVEELKLRNDETRTLDNELSLMRLENESLTEKIEISSKTVASLEKRLITAEDAREEFKLEDKLKNDALCAVEEKLEKIVKEKIETELRMKEVILNMQELRTSQDQVLEAQLQAIDDKSRRLASCEIELKELSESLMAKTRELETVKSRMMNIENDYEILRIKSAEDSTLMKELQCSLDSERLRIHEITENCEYSNSKMAKIEELSRILKNELNRLWDSVRNACPELARPRDENLDCVDKAEDVVASFVEDSKIIRKAVSILSEANETLKEHLDTEKETSRLMSEEAKKCKFAFDEDLKSMKDVLEKRDKYLSSLARRSKDLQGLLAKAIAERDGYDDEHVETMKKWQSLSFEAQSCLTAGNLSSEDIAELREKLKDLDNLIASSNERHARRAKNLLDLLRRIFLWSETKLRDANDVSLLAIDNDFSPEILLSEEIQRDELARKDLTVVSSRIEEFANSLKICVKKIENRATRFVPSNEEKLQAQLDKMSKERKDMKEKLDAARIRNAKMEKNMDELRNCNKKLMTEISEAMTAEERVELETLRGLTKKLEEEKAELSKRIKDGKDVDARLETIHQEYGQKLEKIKQKMKTAYNEQMTKLNQEQEKAIKEKMDSLRIQTEQQCRKYTEDIAKYKAHISDLSSRYWDVGEKLLAETQEKQVAIQQLQRLRGQQQNQETIAEISEKSNQSRQKTASLDRRDFSIDRGTRDPTARAGYRAVEVIEEETTTFSTRRHSVKSIQAMGNPFKAEDEEGEVFDSIFLADLKEGRCAPIGPDFDRLSELRMRNSMCRPHLKSSYAVETNLQPVALNEDDIKNGVTGDDVFNDSLSQSLLPGQKPKKKDRTQTSYKRPGPPTPSKNGGRLSLQGNELKSPNSRVLKERNADRRTTATPRGLKNLFGTSMSKRSQDENTISTPKGRRLSNIFRKQRTERN